MQRIRTPIAWAVGALVLLIPAIASAGQFEDSQSKGLLALYITALTAGFGSSLTPCVYPMIPITVGVFGARDQNTGRLKAFLLATAYVGGMATLYSTLGVLFTLAGRSQGEILANPWIVLPLVAFFLLLALSMFGAFELRLPHALQNRLNQVGGKGFSGAFGMGLVGGLVASPCVGPFMGGLLGYVASTGDVVLGGTVMFTYAIGMGILFWAIAVGALSLPRSGGWMEWIKSIGGIGLVVVALYFLLPIVPQLDALIIPKKAFLLGAIAMAIVGIGIGAVHLSFHDRWSKKLRKGVGVALAVAGIAGAWFYTMKANRELPWEYEEKVAFEKAKAQGKGVMIDFAADWCAPCKKLEKTFAAASVYQILVDHYVPLKFDVTEGSDENEALKERYNAASLPEVIFLDAEGNELGRLTGKYVPPSEFRDILDPATEKLKNGAPTAAAGEVEPAPAAASAQGAL